MVDTLCKLWPTLHTNVEFRNISNIVIKKCLQNIEFNPEDIFGTHEKEYLTHDFFRPTTKSFGQDPRDLVNSSFWG